KKKIKGAEEAIKDTEKELEKIKQEGIETQAITPVPKKQREKKWFEHFRWFYSSQNLLVIAGRDAKTNQEVVEKYMEKNDKYFHADLKGAPHVIVKNDDKEISEVTIEEASQFAGMHSKAWREGLANVDVYWVKPEQVTKEAPSGEYLPKGGYMITGDRTYLKVPIRAAVGWIEIEDTKIPMCGPKSAIESHSENMIEIKPGSVEKNKVAKEIKKELEKEIERDIDIDSLMQILPPGKIMRIKSF
ncbi:hypothetical protein AKJ56_01455, partial [candidate division MSBL1 archaeon SCGC-AAA382N08]